MSGTTATAAEPVKGEAGGLNLIKQAVDGLTTELGVFKAAREQAHGELAKRLDSDLAAINAKLKEWEDKQERTERGYLPGVEYNKSGIKKNAFSIGRAAKLVATKNPSPEVLKECGYEREVFKAMEKDLSRMPESFQAAAVSAISDQVGAALIPLTLMDEILPDLKSMSIAAQLGVQQIFGMTGNLKWVRNSGGISVAYVDTPSEESIAESKPSWETVETTPHVMAAMVPLTWEMLAQAGTVLEPFLRSEILGYIAAREDESIFLGDPALKHPRGLYSMPTGAGKVGTHSWSGTDFGPGQGGATQTVSIQLQNMLGVLEDAKGLQLASKFGWAGSPKTFRKIRNTLDTQARPIFMDANEGFLTTLLDLPVGKTPHLTNSDTNNQRLAVGAWDRCLNLHWGTIAFAASDEAGDNFAKLRRTIRAVLAHDVVFLQPEQFVIATALVAA